MLRLDARKMSCAMVNLPNRIPNESYNDFLIRLFDNGILRAGAIKDNYDKAMSAIQSKIAE